MNNNRHWTREVAVGVASLLCWGLGAAVVMAATPDEDHKRAMRDYQRGDVAAAMRGFDTAAKAGHAPSQVMLAFFFERAGQFDDAARSYRAAAEKADAEGHAGLAGLYAQGRGVAKDEKLAFEHFSKAADAGHVPSIEIVATAWLGKGLGRDATAEPQTAFTAIERAAKGGHLPSAEALAKAYEKGGLFGLSADPGLAASWRGRVQAWVRERAAAGATAGATAGAAAGTAASAPPVKR